MQGLFFNLVLFSFSFSYAQSDVSDFRNSFKKTRAKAEVEFKASSKMNVLKLNVGEELSLEGCQKIQDKVRKNYPVDPFEVIYDSGSTRNFMCGGSSGYLKNFITHSKGVSNLGIPFEMVVQLGHDTPLSSWSTVSNYFIDANYRIVELQSVSHYPPTKELVSYEVSAIDPENNIYSNSWTKSFSVAGKDIEGVRTTQRYISADGGQPYPLYKETVEHKVDPSKDYIVLSLTQSDKVDWADFHLPITHAWSGGFYSYNSKLHRKPKRYSSLNIKFRGGKEVCAFGDKVESGKRIQFPAKNEEYYNCFNY